MHFYAQHGFYLPVLHGVSCLIYGGLLGYIFTKNPKSLVNQLCALILACFILWSAGKIVAHYPGTPYDLASFFRNIVIVGAWTFSSFLLLFSCAITDKKEILRQKWLWVAILFIPCLSICLQWYDGRLLDYVPRSFGWGLAWNSGLGVFILLGFIFTTTLMSAIICFHFCWKTNNEHRRNQCRLIGISILGGTVLGYATNFLFPVLGWESPDLAQNLGVLWTVVIVYAISKYDFLLLSPEVVTDRILSTMSDALILTDSAGHVLTVNASGLNLLGVNHEELEGQHVSSLLWWGNEDSKGISGLLGEEDMRDLGGGIVNRAGKFIPVSVSVTTLKKDGSLPQGKLILARDISERIHHQEALRLSHQELEERVLRRTAELSSLNAELQSQIEQRQEAAAALRQSEAMFRLISEQSLLGIVILCENRVIYTNKSWEQITGFTVEEMLAWGPEKFLTRVHPEDRKHMITQARKKQSGAADYESSYEWRLITKKDQLKWISMYSKPVPYQGQTADLATMIDISDKKEAFLALQESEEKYRLLVENANDAIFIVQEKIIRYVNPKASDMTGYAENELLKMPILHLVHPDDRKEVEDRQRRRVRGEGVATKHNFKLLHRSGDPLWVQSNAVISTWQGQPSILSLVRDVTREKQMEQMINHMQRLEAVGTMAGGISHDFNNILSPILGYAEMLVEELPEDSLLRDNAKQISAAAYRAKELVQQILTFSRQKAIDCKPFDLRLILEEAIKLSQAVIPKNIKVKKSFDTLPQYVLADPTQLHQVIINLITNGYHAMSKGGGILAIELKQPGYCEFMENAGERFLQLSIEDTGVGMDENTLEKIFDPYFTTKDKGSGLGLPVAMAIIEKFNGKIKVVSQPGVGTRFDLFLPVIENITQPLTLDTLQLSASLGNERLLLIDDDHLVLDLFDKVLSKSGYSVEKFSDPEKALAAFCRNPMQYDLVFTDMNMPKISGQRVIETVLAERPDLPVVLCTGYSEDLSSEFLSRSGVQFYLMKPVIKSQLLNVVQLALGKKQREITDQTGDTLAN